MIRVLKICVFLSFGILQCLSQGVIFSPLNLENMDSTRTEMEFVTFEQLEKISRCRSNFQIVTDVRFRMQRDDSESQSLIRYWRPDINEVQTFDFKGGYADHTRIEFDGQALTCLGPSNKRNYQCKNLEEGVATKAVILFIDFNPRQGKAHNNQWSRNKYSLSGNFYKVNCLDQPPEPSVGEYFQEAVDLANRTRWRYFLPEDTDIDQDGRLSDLEIQHKFNTYVGEIFKLMDHDKDNSITEEELRSLKLDIPHLTKAVDIALENFPLRPFFLAADANGDGVYDENDFLMPDGKVGMDQGLSDLVDWPHTSITWEKGGRFLFIADANGDGKLTLEELATKGKELVTKILEFLDENQDGKISIEDIILHIEIGPIQNLVLELFDDVTAGKGEFDIYFMKVAGQDMTKYWFPYSYDYNGDAKLNAADLFSFLDSRIKATFLLPMLSKKLDKNQDGKIQREELRQFVDDLFNQLDMDKDGVITLEDVYSIFQENGMDCLQVGALRIYIEIFLDTLDTEVRDFFVYIFHQWDIDENGQISPAELEQMHVPWKEDFGRKIFFHSSMYQIFPLERHGGGRGGGHGRSGRDGPPRETFLEKFTNKLTSRACEILT